MSTLHAELRRHTSDLHAVLDASLSFLSDTLSRSSYADFLSRLFAWLEPTEHEIAARLPDADLEVSMVHRSEWLAEDLSALGMSLPDAAPNQALPVIQSPAHAVGCWYVVEGSALGGQVICRHVQRLLGLTPSTGVRYFAGAGAHTGERWGAVCAALERYNGATADVVEGARRGFRSLQAWLA